MTFIIYLIYTSIFKYISDKYLLIFSAYDSFTKITVMYKTNYWFNNKL